MLVWKMYDVSFISFRVYTLHHVIIGDKTKQNKTKKKNSHGILHDIFANVVFCPSSSKEFTTCDRYKKCTQRDRIMMGKNAFQLKQTTREWPKQIKLKHIRWDPIYWIENENKIERNFEATHTHTHPQTLQSNYICTFIVLCASINCVYVCAFLMFRKQKQLKANYLQLNWLNLPMLQMRHAQTWAYTLLLKNYQNNNEFYPIEN